MSLSITPISNLRHQDYDDDWRWLRSPDWETTRGEFDIGVVFKANRPRTDGVHMSPGLSSLIEELASLRRRSAGADRKLPTRIWRLQGDSMPTLIYALLSVVTSKYCWMLVIQLLVVSPGFSPISSDNHLQTLANTFGVLIKIILFINLQKLSMTLFTFEALLSSSDLSIFV